MLKDLSSALVVERCLAWGWVPRRARNLSVSEKTLPIKTAQGRLVNSVGHLVESFDLVCFCGACQQATDSTSFRQSFRGADQSLKRVRRPDADSGGGRPTCRS
jgi:hypothetical protein